MKAGRWHRQAPGAHLAASRLRRSTAAAAAVGAREPVAAVGRVPTTAAVAAAGARPMGASSLHAASGPPAPQMCRLPSTAPPVSASRRQPRMALCPSIMTMVHRSARSMLSMSSTQCPPRLNRRKAPQMHRLQAIPQRWCKEACVAAPLQSCLASWVQLWLLPAAGGRSPRVRQPSAPSTAASCLVQPRPPCTSHRQQRMLWA